MRKINKHLISNTDKCFWRGVYKVSNRGGSKVFRARIGVGDGKKESLGYYDDPRVAALAYDVAAVSLHGDRAVTNYPLSIARRELTSRVRNLSRNTRV